MSATKRLESAWRTEVEGMRFFGEPVQDMNRERLLLVIGFLAGENKMLRGDIRPLDPYVPEPEEDDL